MLLLIEAGLKCGTLQFTCCAKPKHLKQLALLLLAFAVKLLCFSAFILASLVRGLQLSVSTPIHLVPSTCYRHFDIHPTPKPVKARVLKSCTPRPLAVIVKSWKRLLANCRQHSKLCTCPSLRLRDLLAERYL